MTHMSDPHPTNADELLDPIGSSAVAAFESDDWLALSARASASVDLGFIAGYRITRIVHRGAQGVVYEAIEPRTARRVAVKRLPQLLHGAELVAVEAARCARETDALAKLGHPNIVSMLAAPQTDDARLIVMEWIDGLPLDAWADGIWERLPAAQALEAITRCHIKISAAIAAAHARGLMHRDLKPSNVLVTADGEPKVLDFGLAKALSTVGGDSLQTTRSGCFAGTPMWAAPEQVAGRSADVDARADVHALGLLLYRALAGQHAFDETLAIGPLFEAIRTVTPKLPSRIRAAVARDLDLIVMHALEKEPARRYPTAAAFGRDLERYLVGDPIDAHPPSAAYVVARFISRHRGLSIATGVAVLAIAAGAIVSTIFAIDAGTSHNAAVAKATEANTARLRAERMNGFFIDLMDNLREREAAGQTSTPKQIIAAAVQAVARTATPKETESDLRTTLGIALHEIADYEGAIEQLNLAVALLEHSPDRTEYARVLGLLSLSQRLADFREASVDTARLSIEVLKSIDAGADLLAPAYDSLAYGFMNTQQDLASRATIDAALALAQRAEDPLILANAMSTHSLILDREGSRRQAAQVAAEAVAVARTAPEVKPKFLARLLHNEAYLLMQTGREAASLPIFDEAIALKSGYFGPRHPALIGTRSQRGLALSVLGRHDEAIAYLNETLGFYEAPSTTPVASRGNLMRHLGRSYMRRGGDGDSQRAEELFRTATIENAQIGSAHWGRTAAVVAWLARTVDAAKGRAASEGLLGEFAESVGRVAKDTVTARFVRAEIFLALTGAGMNPPFVATPAHIEQCQRDLAAVEKQFDANTVESIGMGFSLASVLAASESKEDREQALVQAAALKDRSVVLLGELSPMTREIAAHFAKHAK